MSAKCSGLCLDSGDVGVPGYGIAYAHPMCPKHSDPHPFQAADVHCSGSVRCECGAYEDEHLAMTTTPPSCSCGHIAYWHTELVGSQMIGVPCRHDGCDCTDVFAGPGGSDA